jgi:hypothetical protein
MKIFICSVILVFIFLTFFSCEKSPTNSDSKNSFSMQFTNNYIRGNGWAILHNSDGTQIEKAEQIFGDGIVNFGDIGRDRVTCTFIDIYEEMGSNVVYITSDYNAPGGSWVLKGYDFYFRGDVTIQTTFTPGSYDRWVVSVPASSSYGSGTPPWNLSKSIVQLDEGDSFSGFAAVYESNANNGVCGWILNQTYIEGEANSYTINLNTPMEYKTITTSLPVNYVRINSYRGNNYLNFAQYHWSDYSNPQTIHNVYYTSAFPAVKFGIRVAYNESNFGTTTLINSTTIPNVITIPNYSLSADYNDVLDQYENIFMSGTADQIGAYWYYYDSNSDTRFYWRIFVPANTTSITLPFLSQNIISDTGIDIAQLQANYIRMIDYDVASNMDDIINMVFKNNSVFTSLYNTSYSYTKNF